ncbi:LEA type 2 family protein [Dyadobacter sp. CY326]|uniref:NDR1/HIN1-like protein n=1 Tax=Dyadobacter sp. CY326 TaxID=2907300 RepID=UPI001F23681C|nr:LEA type 2 family protein [Dyadobacter sp. CY326]MCE7064946.1 LEA type 2 family protein [Dyadobacter sp. CY326]
MRSNRWLIVLLVVAVLVGIGIWWWKSPTSDVAKQKAVDKVTPTVSVASLNITNIDADRIKMTSKVTISNPLPVDINTRKLNYVIYIDSIKVIEDAYEKPLSIPSSDSVTIELPMALLLKPMTQVLKHFDDENIDSANYAMTATFETDVPIAGERKFKMDIAKKLPALRLPKVKITQVDLNALALKSKGMDVDVEVYNPNQFPLKISNSAFSFDLEDAMQMKGVLEKVISIPAKGRQNVSMHAKVTDGSVLKSGWKLLTDKKDTQFKALFSGNIDSENKMLSNSKMAMKMTGTLDEVMNAVKEVKE